MLIILAFTFIVLQVVNAQLNLPNFPGSQEINQAHKVAPGEQNTSPEKTRIMPLAAELSIGPSKVFSQYNEDLLGDQLSIIEEAGSNIVPKKSSASTNTSPLLRKKRHKNRRISLIKHFHSKPEKNQNPDVQEDSPSNEDKIFEEKSHDEDQKEEFGEDDAENSGRDDDDEDQGKDDENDDDEEEEEEGDEGDDSYQGENNNDNSEEADSETGLNDFENEISTDVEQTPGALHGLQKNLEDIIFHPLQKLNSTLGSNAAEAQRKQKGGGAKSKNGDLHSTDIEALDKSKANQLSDAKGDRADKTAQEKNLNMKTVLQLKKSNKGVDSRMTGSAGDAKAVDEVTENAVKQKKFKLREKSKTRTDADGDKANVCGEKNATTGLEEKQSVRVDQTCQQKSKELLVNNSKTDEGLEKQYPGKCVQSKNISDKLDSKKVTCEKKSQEKERKTDKSQDKVEVTTGQSKCSPHQDLKEKACKAEKTCSPLAKHNATGKETKNEHGGKCGTQKELTKTADCGSSKEKVTERVVCITQNLHLTASNFSKQENTSEKMSKCNSKEDSKVAHTVSGMKSNQEVTKKEKNEGESKLGPFKNAATKFGVLPAGAHKSENSHDDVKPVTTPASGEKAKEQDLIIMANINDTLNHTLNPYTLNHTFNAQERLKALEARIFLPLIRGNLEKKQAEASQATKCTKSTEIGCQTEPITTPTTTCPTCSTTCTTTCPTTSPTTSPTTTKRSTSCPPTTSKRTTPKTECTTTCSKKTEKTTQPCTQPKTDPCTTPPESSSAGLKLDLLKMKIERLGDLKSSMEKGNKSARPKGCEKPDICQSPLLKSDPCTENEVTTESKEESPTIQPVKCPARREKTLTETQRCRGNTEVKRPLERYLNLLNSLTKKSGKLDERKLKYLGLREKSADQVAIPGRGLHVSSPVVTHDSVDEDLGKNLFQVDISQANEPTMMPITLASDPKSNVFLSDKNTDAESETADAKIADTDVEETQATENLVSSSEGPNFLDLMFEPSIAKPRQTLPRFFKQRFSKKITKEKKKSKKGKVEEGTEASLYEDIDEQKGTKGITEDLNNSKEKLSMEAMKKARKSDIKSLLSSLSGLYSKSGFNPPQKTKKLEEKCVEADSEKRIVEAPEKSEQPVKEVEDSPEAQKRIDESPEKIQQQLVNETIGAQCDKIKSRPKAVRKNFPQRIRSFYSRNMLHERQKDKRNKNSLSSEGDLYTHNSRIRSRGVKKLFPHFGFRSSRARSSHDRASDYGDSWDKPTELGTVDIGENPAGKKRKTLLVVRRKGSSPKWAPNEVDEGDRICPVSALMSLVRSDRKVRQGLDERQSGDGALDSFQSVPGRSRRGTITKRSSKTGEEEINKSLESGRPQRSPIQLHIDAGDAGSFTEGGKLVRITESPRVLLEEQKGTNLVGSEESSRRLRWSSSDSSGTFRPKFDSFSQILHPNQNDNMILFSVKRTPNQPVEGLDLENKARPGKSDAWLSGKGEGNTSVQTPKEEPTSLPKFESKNTKNSGPTLLTEVNTNLKENSLKRQNDQQFIPFKRLGDGNEGRTPNLLVLSPSTQHFWKFSSPSSQQQIGNSPETDLNSKNSSQPDTGVYRVSFPGKTDQISLRNKIYPQLAIVTTPPSSLQHIGYSPETDLNNRNLSQPDTGMYRVSFPGKTYNQTMQYKMYPQLAIVTTPSSLNLIHDPLQKQPFTERVIYTQRSDYKDSLKVSPSPTKLSQLWGKKENFYLSPSANSTTHKTQLQDLNQYQLGILPHKERAVDSQPPVRTSPGQRPDPTTSPGQRPNPTSQVWGQKGVSLLYNATSVGPMIQFPDLHRYLFGDLSHKEQMVVSQPPDNRASPEQDPDPTIQAWGQKRVSLLFNATSVDPRIPFQDLHHHLLENLSHKEQMVVSQPPDFRSSLKSGPDPPTTQTWEKKVYIGHKGDSIAPNTQQQGMLRYGLWDQSNKERAHPSPPYTYRDSWKERSSPKNPYPEFNHNGEVYLAPNADYLPLKAKYQNLFHDQPRIGPRLNQAKSNLYFIGEFFPEPVSQQTWRKKERTFLAAKAGYISQDIRNLAQNAENHAQQELDRLPFLLGDTFASKPLAIHQGWGKIGKSDLTPKSNYGETHTQYLINSTAPLQFKARCKMNNFRSLEPWQANQTRFSCQSSENKINFTNGMDSAGQVVPQISTEATEPRRVEIVYLGRTQDNVRGKSGLDPFPKFCKLQQLQASQTRNPSPSVNRIYLQNAMDNREEMRRQNTTEVIDTKNLDLPHLEEAHDTKGTSGVEPYRCFCEAKPSHTSQTISMNRPPFNQVFFPETTNSSIVEMQPKTVTEVTEPEMTRLYTDGAQGRKVVGQENFQIFCGPKPSSACQFPGRINFSNHHERVMNMGCGEIPPTEATGVAETETMKMGLADTAHNRIPVVESTRNICVQKPLPSQPADARQTPMDNIYYPNVVHLNTLPPETTTQLAEYNTIVMQNIGNVQEVIKLSSRIEPCQNFCKPKVLPPETNTEVAKPNTVEKQDVDKVQEVMNVSSRIEPYQNLCKPKLLPPGTNTEIAEPITIETLNIVKVQEVMQVPSEIEPYQYTCKPSPILPETATSSAEPRTVDTLNFDTVQEGMQITARVEPFRNFCKPEPFCTDLKMSTNGLPLGSIYVQSAINLKREKMPPETIIGAADPKPMVTNLENFQDEYQQSSSVEPPQKLCKPKPLLASQKLCQSLPSLNQISFPNETDLKSEKLVSKTTFDIIEPKTVEKGNQHEVKEKMRLTLDLEPKGLKRETRELSGIAETGRLENRIARQIVNVENTMRRNQVTGDFSAEKKAQIQRKKPTLLVKDDILPVDDNLIKDITSLVGKFEPKTQYFEGISDSAQPHSAPFHPKIATGKNFNFVGVGDHAFDANFVPPTPFAKTLFNGGKVTRNHVIPRPVQFLSDNPKNYYPVLPVLPQIETQRSKKLSETNLDPKMGSTNFHRGMEEVRLPIGRKEEDGWGHNVQEKTLVLKNSIGSREPPLESQNLQTSGIFGSDDSQNFQFSTSQEHLSGRFSNSNEKFEKSLIDDLKMLHYQADEIDNNRPRDLGKNLKMPNFEIRTHDSNENDATGNKVRNEMRLFKMPARGMTGDSATGSFEQPSDNIRGFNIQGDKSQWSQDNLKENVDAGLKSKERKMLHYGYGDISETDNHDRKGYNIQSGKKNEGANYHKMLSSPEDNESFLRHSGDGDKSVTETVFGFSKQKTNRISDQNIYFPKEVGAKPPYDFCVGSCLTPLQQNLPLFGVETNAKTEKKTTKFPTLEDPNQTSAFFGNHGKTSQIKVLLHGLESQTEDEINQSKNSDFFYSKERDKVLPLPPEILNNNEKATIPEQHASPLFRNEAKAKSHSERNSGLRFEEMPGSSQLRKPTFPTLNERSRGQHPSRVRVIGTSSTRPTIMSVLRAQKWNKQRQLQKVQHFRREGDGADIKNSGKSNDTRLSQMPVLPIFNLGKETPPGLSRGILNYPEKAGEATDESRPFQQAEMLSGTLAMKVVDSVLSKMQSENLLDELGLCNNDLKKIKEDILPEVPVESKNRARFDVGVMAAIKDYLDRQSEAACMVLTPGMKRFLGWLINDKPTKPISMSEDRSKMQVLSLDPIGKENESMFSRESEDEPDLQNFKERDKNCLTNRIKPSHQSRLSKKTKSKKIYKRSSVPARKKNQTSEI